MPQAQGLQVDVPVLTLNHQGDFPATSRCVNENILASCANIALLMDCLTNLTSTLAVCAEIMGEMF